MDKLKRIKVKYAPVGDVNGIECKIYDAGLVIRPSESNNFSVEFPKAINIRATSGDGKLYIKQGKRRFFDRFKEQVITVRIPEHALPEILVYANSADVLVEGGIYKSVNVSATDSKISLCGCSFDEVTLNGGKISLKLTDGTIKDKLIGKTDGGDVVVERSFIGCAEYRSGECNVGLASLNTKDCTFELDGGNITATLCESEKDYSFSLLSRDGTRNRESSVKDGVKRKFRAYCAKGNISVDFIGDLTLNVKNKDL